ncbi:E3 SUMO-protein ligase ZBED1-like [Diabrotica virgifera virgifera]|uniref:DUF659 domain-containing protein n=1 Tax=Diabrotica virgifera virgifera TaxID=50390 RepID=A0ABM5L1W3_DIAVI|nr:E3 SUMO-protein ligase ZBED1-like [Diabrotica virgifera virgifera]
MTVNRKKLLYRAAVEMVCLDYQPFTIVDDVGFRKLVYKLDPRYVLPSAFTVGGKLLSEFYTDISNKLQDILRNIDFVAITCDGWTSRAMESYVTVTCHYVDEHFKLNVVVLSTKALTNGIHHTAENIAETLLEIFNEWNMEQKVSCIVTYNAPNYIKACKMLKERHIPCYAHTLNLVVQDNLKYVQDFITKCKDIVTFFKSSNIATKLFKNEQEQDRAEPYQLLQEVSTRWNSTYYMVQRILITNDAIGRTILKLRKLPQPLSVDDIIFLTDVQKVL